jgi:hypothetical protein
MKIYTVLSRDRGDFIHTTTDEGEAEFVKKEQTMDEEMAGGRPSVYIRTSTLDDIKMEKFSEGYEQGLEHAFLENGKINLERGCKVLTFDEFKSAVQSLKIQGISETDFERIFDDCTEAVHGKKFSSTAFNRRKAKEAFTKLLQPNVPDDIREFVGETMYDDHGQMIFRGVDKDNLQMFLDVRGWGAIQNMGFKTQQEMMDFQDKVGRWVTDVINDKLKHI